MKNDAMKIHAARLGLGKSDVAPARANKPIFAILLTVTIGLGFAGYGWGLVDDARAKDHEKRLAAQQAEKGKATRLDQIETSALGRLGGVQEKLKASVERIEAQAQASPRIKGFIDQYPLPADIRQALDNVIDLSAARDQDKKDWGGEGEPPAMEAKFQEWKKHLDAATRWLTEVGPEIRQMGYGGQVAVTKEFAAEFEVRKTPAVDAVAEPVVEVQIEPEVVEQEYQFTAAPPQTAEMPPLPREEPLIQESAPQLKVQQPVRQQAPAQLGKQQVTDW